VGLHQRIEEGLIAVVQGGQVDVLLEVAGLLAVALVGAGKLLVEGRNMRWQQTKSLSG